MGWNLYAREEHTDPDFAIENNLATSLSLGQGYVLLPKAEDPTSPEQVWLSLERLAIKLDRQLPTIEIKGQRVQMLGVKPNLNSIHIDCPEGIDVSYDELLKALPSFFDISQS